MSRPTIHTLEFTADDLASGGSYDDFQPGKYVGTLESVEDVEAKNTGNVGWKWTFSVNGLRFNTVTWLKGGGTWKLNEVVNALGGILTAGTNRIDPTLYIGSQAGVTIGRDAKSNYPDRLTILNTFPLPDGANNGLQEI